MTKLNNWPLAYRLGLGFAILLILMLTMMAVGLGVLHTSNRNVEEMGRLARASSAIERWQQMTLLNRARTLAVVKSDSENLKVLFAPMIAETSQQIGEVHKAVEQLITPADERALLGQVGQLREEMLDARKKLMSGGGDSNPAAVDVAFDAYVQALGALAEQERELAAKAAAEVERASGEGGRWLRVFGFMGVLVGVLTAWQITRSVTRPAARAVNFTRTIADGDLTQPIRTLWRDEMGQVLGGLKIMQGSLHEIVGRVRSGVDSIVLAGGKIAAGSEDLSLRTEEAASSLQQIATSLTQMHDHAQQGSDASNAARELVQTMHAAAQRGGRVMAEAEVTMEAVHVSAREITDIIGVIDSIAFQTNILALNAAVEAARAGEQGRGFAVVASEVRGLAQRSANAASNIKSLIDSSVRKIESGATLTKEAGTAVTQIVDSIKRLGNVAAERTQTAIKQTQSLGEVTLAVSQLDRMTRQNAELVEQSAAAATSLKAQADELKRVVEVFRLHEVENQPAADSGAVRPGSPRGKTMPWSSTRSRPALGSPPEEVESTLSG